MTVISLSLPKLSDVNFREESGTLRHSGFWHFTGVVKAEGMTQKMRKGGYEDIYRNIQHIHSLTAVYHRNIAPLFRIYPEELKCKHSI